MIITEPLDTVTRLGPEMFNVMLCPFAENFAKSGPVMIVVPFVNVFAVSPFTTKSMDTGKGHDVVSTKFGVGPACALAYPHKHLAQRPQPQPSALALQAVFSWSFLLCM
jgi:hypothetical protein